MLGAKSSLTARCWPESTITFSYSLTESTILKTACMTLRFRTICQQIPTWFLAGTQSVIFATRSTKTTVSLLFRMMLPLKVSSLLWSTKGSLNLPLTGNREPKWTLSALKVPSGKKLTWILQIREQMRWAILAMSQSTIVFPLSAKRKLLRAKTSGTVPNVKTMCQLWRKWRSIRRQSTW